MKTKKTIAMFLGIEMFILNVFNVFAIYNSGENISDGIYMIESALDSNKVLDIDNCSKENFASLQLYEKNYTDAQKFYVHKLQDGSFEIQALCSNKFLTVTRENCGEKVFQKSFDNDGYQKWLITPVNNEYFYISSNSNNYALSVYNSAHNNQTAICIYNKRKLDSQKFKFVPIKIFDTENYTISSDKRKIPISSAKNLINKLGHDWDDETIRKIIEKSSMCFGAYDSKGTLIGFARIITDYETTCFVMNVVVDSNYRGKGIGTMIMRNILEDEKLQKCRFSLIPSTHKVAKWYRLIGFKSTGWDYMSARPIYRK